MSFAFVNAQETSDTSTTGANKSVDFRTNALRQLGLNRDQLQRIRVLNQERKPLMDAAQQRLRQANRSLDEIIYSDSPSDADLQARLRDFQAAQAEVAKIRFMHEFGVRRILNPEQLTKFRNLRQRFDNAREVNTKAPVVVRTPTGQGPLQKLKQNIRDRRN